MVFIAYGDALVRINITLKELAKASFRGSSERPQLRGIGDIANCGNDMVASSEQLAHPFKANAATRSNHNPGLH